MGQFLSKPSLDIGDESGDWITCSPLVYSSTVAARVITIRERFHTDLASIPRLFQWLIPVNGKHRLAAIVHDYLYSVAPRWCDRKMADRILLEAMTDLGEAWWRRTAMYAAVRIGGWMHWRDCRECKH